MNATQPRFAFSRPCVASAASLRSGCCPLPFRSRRRVAPRHISGQYATPVRHGSRTAPAPLLSRGVQLRGILRSSMLPLSVPVSDSTGFLLHSRGVSSAASLRSGRYPLQSLLSRGTFRSFRDITQVRMLPSFVFAFSRLFEASATSLRSGCSPPSLLSRGCQLRGIAQVKMLPSFLFAFSRLLKPPRHPQVRMLPTSFSFSSA